MVLTVPICSNPQAQENPSACGFLTTCSVADPAMKQILLGVLPER
jgi:hypothetical protein